MFHKSSSSGFTFAELALVLMIIGVIAAMTIPSLKKHSQRSEFARNAQKAYFTLNECYEQALLINGPAYKWKSGTASGNISTHLKLTPQGTTQDGMNYSISCSNTGCNFTVDINGSTKDPNRTGKDIHKYKLTFGKADTTKNAKDADQIVCDGDTKTLQQNNWKYTDALWNK